MLSEWRKWSKIEERNIWYHTLLYLSLCRGKKKLTFITDIWFKLKFDAISANVSVTCFARFVIEMRFTSVDVSYVTFYYKCKVLIFAEDCLRMEEQTFMLALSIMLNNNDHWHTNSAFIVIKVTMLWGITICFVVSMKLMKSCQQ